MNKERLRKLPSINSILIYLDKSGVTKKYGREAVLRVARAVAEELRAGILSKEAAALEENDLSLENMGNRIRFRLERRMAPSLRRAINATGILMHSGLGRAVLARDAAEALSRVSLGYCNLALDQQTGRRGDRYSHLSGLFHELTGAEASLVVNNNAAATVLILNTLARGKEVVISRGQLVEIGGSFRLPEVMETSGALLREIGATNKTHLRDYEAAINEKTGALMRVHHSNYRIVGFAEEPGIEELIELGKKYRIPVIDDLGSGALVDLKQFGLETEPLVKTSIAAGIDVACFSGDKLIGGPQSGVIVGQAALIAQIRKNPLMRAFRVGKLTIAAMEATLRLFLNPENLKEHHPLYRTLCLSLKELEQRANKTARKLRKVLPDQARFVVEKSGSQVGSGSAPVETIPTKVLSVKPAAISAESLAKNLRFHEPPIFARVQKDAVLLDLRTIQADEDPLVENALLKILSK